MLFTLYFLDQLTGMGITNLSTRIHYKGYVNLTTDKSGVVWFSTTFSPYGTYVQIYVYESLMYPSLNITLKDGISYIYLIPKQRKSIVASFVFVDESTKKPIYT